MKAGAVASTYNFTRGSGVREMKTSMSQVQFWLPGELQASETLCPQNRLDQG